MVHVFVDFDGTVTRGDVGDALFERFGGRSSLDAVEAYRRGEISAVECFRRECEACGPVPLDELRAFLDAREIDPTFPEFDAWCRRRGYPLTIVSDGMDVYIRAILERHGLGHVPFVSNLLALEPDGAGGRARFRPSFPNADEVCDRCASCKRNHMLNAAADDDVIVYAGEGYSDRCPVRYADVVFAKDELVRHCEEQSVPFYPYSSFSDVSARLERLTAPAPGGAPAALPRRRRAVLARKDVFLGG